MYDNLGNISDNNAVGHVCINGWKPDPPGRSVQYAKLP